VRAGAENARGGAAEYDCAGLEYAPGDDAPGENVRDGARYGSRLEGDERGLDENVRDGEPRWALYGTSREVEGLCIGGRGECDIVVALDGWTRPHDELASWWDDAGSRVDGRDELGMRAACVEGPMYVACPVAA
jgi:hypothetical protein